jgi:hypothetical protein
MEAEQCGMRWLRAYALWFLRTSFSCGNYHRGEVIIDGDSSMGRFRDIFVPLNNRNDGGAMPNHNTGLTRGAFNW